MSKRKSQPIPSTGTGLTHARQILEHERQQRIEQCRNEINAALEKYKCRIEPIIILRQNAVIPQLEIVPLD